MKKRKKAAVTGPQLGWNDGYHAGYKLGSDYGYWTGRREAVVRKVSAEPTTFWDLKMIYVASGKGFPYSPLDHSIMETLGKLVSELHVVQPEEDLVQAVDAISPQLVLVLDGLSYPVEPIDSVRARGVKTAIWLTDDPYYTDMTVDIAPHYDYVFTLDLSCVSLYQSYGCSQVHYLPFAADPNLYVPQRVPYGENRDVGFVGSAYWNRVAFFDKMAPFLSDKKMNIVGIWWDRLSNYELLAPKIRLNHWMGAAETAYFYSGTRIVINMHRAHNDDSYNKNSRLIEAMSPNPRTFEICSTGALQLTDARSDLTRFYKPGEEIVTYSSPEELIQKLDYYLNHEEERRSIALRALERTRREHTYANRLTQMLQIIVGS
ncbi:CgeB family protein [Paenibacillus turpanensis]|uniref:CgeB family protein n=1 Tax=Paenibacillus turpanensis TaxID=2689078 RepID=UPI00140AAF1D|nr:glycosyltransferase [Paenibacillus turpanensis]